MILWVGTGAMGIIVWIVLCLKALEESRGSIICYSSTTHHRREKCKSIYAGLLGRLPEDILGKHQDQYTQGSGEKSPF